MPNPPRKSRSSQSANGRAAAPRDDDDDLGLQEEPDYTPGKASTGNERWLLVPNERLADLLRGVVVVCGENEFPSEVVVTRDGRIGAQLQQADAEKIQKTFFAGVSRVSVEFQSGLTEPRPLREVIRPTFSPVDLAAEANAMRPADRRAFLFAASSDDRAQRLLHELVTVTTPGIQVRPLGQGGKYQSLWLVEGRHPPRGVFDAADKSWWAPAADRDRETVVFVPYPYRSNIHRDDLDRVDWGMPRGFVLLNEKDGPVLIPAFADSPSSLPLIGVANLTADHRAAVVCVPDDSPGTTFDVKLKLVPRGRAGSPTLRLQERIRELELDIEQRRQTVDRLSNELTLEAETLPNFYTPLFAYRDTPGEAPTELRRLAVEWADQRQLRELLYVRLRADSLPPAFAASGRDLHLLATATGVNGRPEQDGRDLWLREYAPADGFRFDMQPNWVAHDLRLFLPDDADRRMELYPEIDGGLFSELRPGNMVAERLGRALCPTAVTADHLYLLAPGEDAVSAISVPRSAFRPLVDSFPWRCGVVVTQKPAAAVEQDAPAVREAFVEGIDAAFRTALGSVAADRIRARQTDFQQEIAAVNREFDSRRKTLASNKEKFDQELKARQDRLEEMRKRLSELDELLTTAGVAARQALADGAALKTPLREITGNAEQAGIYLEELKTLTNQIGKLTSQATRLAEEAARFARSEGRQ